MSFGELTGDLKTNREESLTKHVGSYMPMQRNQKIEKLIWERWRQAEKARIIINNKKQDTFQFDFEDALLILASLN